MANANTGGRSIKGTLIQVLGLVLFVALIWLVLSLVLSIVKGMMSVILTVLFIGIAAFLVWRLYRAISRRR